MLAARAPQPQLSAKCIFFRQKKSACTFFSPDRGDCRLRKMKQNESLLAKIGFGTAENEPSNVGNFLGKFSKKETAFSGQWVVWSPLGAPGEMFLQSPLSGEKKVRALFFSRKKRTFGGEREDAQISAPARAP